MSEYIVHTFLRIATESEPKSYGRLRTIGPKFLLPNAKGKRIPFQVCVCDCGAFVICRTNQLRPEGTASCGCLKRQVDRDKCIRMSYKHGEASRANPSPEHATWADMRKRCRNPRSTHYRHYGGRGIRVCDRWQGENGFVYFLEDMGRKPSPAHSIDRIDVDGDYCPENCRWATAREQESNKRNSVYITAFGKTLWLPDWAAETGISTDTIRYRIKQGWNPEVALTKMPKARKKIASGECG